MMLGLGTENENPLLQDRPTAEIVPELSPHLSDVIVTKTRFSGFWGTNLHEILKSRDIESLVFAGGTTTVCMWSPPFATHCSWSSMRSFLRTVPPTSHPSCTNPR